MVMYFLAVTILLLLILIYRTLPRKRVFAYFLPFLLVLGVGAYYLSPPSSQPQTVTAEERDRLVAQQVIFAEWNGVYQKKIDQLDYNWQSYHNILANFAADNISIQTAYLRLKQLDDDARLLEESLKKLDIPQELKGACYHNLSLIMEKTRNYAAAQHRAISLTKAAADPQNLRSENHADQYQDLKTIMLRESPAGLFTAKEMYGVKMALSLPEEKAMEK